MKKLMKKKNNKGFSLVELIVVVLILGIIAVALAPQVMKWVGTARKNSDENTAKDIKSSVQTALADWQSRGGEIWGSSSTTVTVTFDLVKGSPIAVNGTFNDLTGDDTLVKCLEEVIGSDNKQYPKSSSGDGKFSVTLTGNGKNISVAVSYPGMPTN